MHSVKLKGESSLGLAPDPVERWTKLDWTLRPSRPWSLFEHLVTAPQESQCPLIYTEDLTLLSLSLIRPSFQKLRTHGKRRRGGANCWVKREETIPHCYDGLSSPKSPNQDIQSSILVPSALGIPATHTPPSETRAIVSSGVYGIKEADLSLQQRTPCTETSS